MNPSGVMQTCQKNRRKKYRIFEAKTHPTRPVKFTRPRSLGAKLTEKYSTGREHLGNIGSNYFNQDIPKLEVQIYSHLNPVIPTVSNNNVALIVDSDPVGSGELPILCAF